MLSPNCDIAEFMEKLQGKGFVEMMQAANYEAAAVEGIPAGKRAYSENQYRGQLGAFLFLLRFGKRPDSADDALMETFRPAIKSLVDRGDFNAGILDVFPDEAAR